jgi:hypothetical protein
LQLDDNDNGDSRGTYRDDADSVQFGNNFPLSQISLASGEDLILPTRGEGAGDGEDTETETEIEANSSGTSGLLHRILTDGTAGASVSVSGTNPKNALQRKPSFLEPGSHYDGGGFQFMSGLSQ